MTPRSATTPPTNSDTDSGLSHPVGSVLISTKLHAPAGRELVRRPELVARLATPASGHKLTLVVAPPGWGKTTLLAQWAGATAERRPFAWVSLDPADNDPVQFWAYLIAALRTAVPGIGTPASGLLGAPGTDIVRDVLPALLNELAGLPGRLVLVLDDYHAITTGAIHQAMAFLLDHLPASLHIVLATRTDPPLPLPRLRVRGELLEVRAAELRFSQQEAAQFLNSVLGLDLDDAEVALLCQRTEGWAAGLYLAALSLRGRGDRRAFIQAFAGDDRHIVDYLGAETLDGLPAAVRAFLLHTSILDRLCGPLCDAVTATSGSDRRLEDVERSNLFLMPLDTKRAWYRYHQLFAGLLRHELTQTQPQLVPVLHRRAAAWHRQAGDVPEAIRHATAAGDHAEAAELIVRHWTDFLQRGQLHTVAGWLEELPAPVVTGDPRLCLTKAWLAVNTGQIDQLDRWIQAAEQAVRHGPARHDAVGFQAAAAMLRCIHWYLSGDVGQAIQAAQHALTLERAETAPWRSVGCPVLGIARFWSGAAPDAASTLEQAIDRARPAGNHLAVVHAFGGLAAIHAERGALDQADQLARTATRLADEHGLAEHWATTLARVVAGKALAQQGRLDEAEAALGRAVELSRRGVARVEHAYSLLTLAQLHHTQGATNQAKQLLGEARQAVAGCPDPGILADLVATTERRLRLAPVRRVDPATDPEGLTDRERAVLRLLPSGLSQREIAAALYVSPNTVKTHLRGIYHKLAASTRSEAVTRARELDLV